MAVPAPPAGLVSGVHPTTEGPQWGPAPGFGPWTVRAHPGGCRRVAGAGRRPGPLPGGRPRLLRGPRVGDRGSGAGAGVRADSPRPGGARARARRLPRAEDKVRSADPPQFGHRARRGEAGRACAPLGPPRRPRPDSGLGLPRPLRALTIVVDPGRLQELHCSAAAAAGLRREPRPSARPGHGATAAASSRAALRPPPAPRPQRRRAIAGPRPPPPPQPPPALGRRRRRHSRIPCAAPPPAAPGQRRKSRRAPAKSPRRETAPRADGAARAPPRAGAQRGGSAGGAPRARPPPKGELGGLPASGASSGGLGRRGQAGSGPRGRPLPSSTSRVPSPTPELASVIHRLLGPWQTQMREAHQRAALLSFWELIPMRAEPLRKKKKVDPKKDQAVKDRLKKRIRRLEKASQELIPIEDFIIPAKLLDKTSHVSPKVVSAWDRGGATGSS
ncbi:large ribosomal subunit protein mL40 isoform X3 [Vulpes vulpes]|uniref:Large ribosomal subunit protein mL40 n=1 Tax=Vulpes vulpes TaxID=9627 RepID=A0ABM4XNF6_VULVU